MLSKKVRKNCRQKEVIIEFSHSDVYKKLQERSISGVASVAQR